MAYGSLNIKDDIVTTISTLPSPPPVGTFYVYEGDSTFPYSYGRLDIRYGSFEKEMIAIYYCTGYNNNIYYNTFLDDHWSGWKFCSSNPYYIDSALINGWTGDIRCIRDGNYAYLDFTAYGDTVYNKWDLLEFANIGAQARPQNIVFGTGSINAGNCYLGSCKIDIRYDGILIAIFSNDIASPSSDPIYITGDFIYPLY